MQPVTIPQIVDRLRKLSSEQLVTVYDFVSHLADKGSNQGINAPSENLQSMLASEAVLRRDWDRPEEDAAWRNL